MHASGTPHYRAGSERLDEEFEPSGRAKHVYVDPTDLHPPETEHLFETNLAICI